jgi:sirohydrochlorin cobaltochelatase
MNVDFLYKLAIGTILGVTLLVGSSLFDISKVSAQNIEKNTKAIIVVSFGTTFADARISCIESVENRITEAFPEYDVYRAFTSKFVIKRLAERDHISVSDLETVLAKLKKEGYKEVIIQTTHLTPGEEYDKKVLATVAKFNSAFEKLAIGRPLLTFNGENCTSNDFVIALKAMQQQMPILQMKDKTVVFMGHGSPNQHNPAYENMQKQFDAAGINAIVGVVEESDHPNFADVKKLLKERNIKRIILMPMMLVAGDHVNNDMAGADNDSWKSQLLAEGYQVETYLHGLGENAAIQDIYVQHVRDAIQGLK